jgi:outer membrane protein TolC
MAAVLAATVRASDPVTPEQAVQIALRSNRLVRIATLEAGASSRSISVAGTRLWPVLSISADEGELLAPLVLRIPQGALGQVPGLGAFPVKSTDITTNPQLTTLALVTIAQPLTQLPRIRLGVQLAQEEAGLSGELLRERRLQIADEVRDACYDLARAEAGNDAAGAAVKYANESVRAAKEAIASRTILDSVEMEVEARRLDALQKASSAANAVESARMHLNQLLGRDLFEPLEIDLSAEQEAFLPTREVARAQAIGLRPEVREAARKLNMARLALRIRRREDDPDVSLTLSAAKTTSIDALPDPVVMLGLHATWNPVDWGRKRTELDQRSAQVQEADLALEEARAQVALDVDVRYRAVGERKDALAAAESAFAAAREQHRVVSERFRAGAALPKDVLEADFNEAEAKASWVAARCDLRTAESALTRAMGKE